MFKIERKVQGSPKQVRILRVIAVVVALAASALIILLMGYNPFEIFSGIIEGSVGNQLVLVKTINKAIPLVILSLGVAIAFKMKFWNIGAEGQFYIGAWITTFFALYVDLPIYVMLPLMAVSSVICAGAWILIPALLKSKIGTNETIVTLMMNYVASEIIKYFQYGPWRDPKAYGMPKVANFDPNCQLPTLFGVHIGWIVALVLVVIVYIVMKHSKLGYEISVLGESEHTARYAGMSVTKTIVVAALISGGICGLAGMIQATGVEHTMNEYMSSGLGFTAIITAWLANLSAPIILIVSFLFAMLLQGGAFISVALQIPASLAEVLQGIILFFVISSEFFMSYKVVWRSKGLKGGKK